MPCGSRRRRGGAVVGGLREDLPFVDLLQGLPERGRVLGGEDVAARVASYCERYAVAAKADGPFAVRLTWTPSPRADKRTLLRRLTFDLTGLPPTPEELAAFEADRSPDAAAISRTAAGWKGAGETAPLVAVPLSVVRDIALLSSGAEAAIMNEDLEELLRPVAARMSPDGWTRALRELLGMSRMPPQAQKPLMLEAFLFGLHGKE